MDRSYERSERFRFRLLQDSFSVDNRCDHNFVLQQPVDDSVAIDDQLVDVLVVDSGTLRPEFGNWASVLV